MKPRYTVHSYSGYWWIRDNATGEAARSHGGASRLIYHPRKNTWEEIGKAQERAQRKADKLNQETRRAAAELIRHAHTTRRACDHINGDPTDYRLENLRVVTLAANR